jgi:hypothetical protein
VQKTGHGKIWYRKIKKNIKGSQKRNNRVDITTPYILQLIIVELCISGLFIGNLSLPNLVSYKIGFCMSKITKRLILIIITAVVVVTGVTAYMLWNKPHKDVKDASSVEVTAADMYNIFVTDSVKAGSLYADKVVKLSGKIAKLSLNQESQQVILVETDVAGAYINCTMEEKTTGIIIGDKITLKGICSGYISGDMDMGLPGDVFLTRCYVHK